MLPARPRRLVGPSTRPQARAITPPLLGVKTKAHISSYPCSESHGRSASERGGGGRFARCRPDVHGEAVARTERLHTSRASSQHEPRGIPCGSSLRARDLAGRVPRRSTRASRSPRPLRAWRPVRDSRMSSYPSIPRVHRIVTERDVTPAAITGSARPAAALGIGCRRGYRMFINGLHRDTPPRDQRIRFGRIIEPRMHRRQCTVTRPTAEPACWCRASRCGAKRIYRSRRAVARNPLCAATRKNADRSAAPASSARTA